MPAAPAYPVHVEGHLDPATSRGLWLVKWLFVIPHYLVLAFLWAAFAVLSVVAFFAILFTGRYPRAVFDFNVGVLRWSWRVAFYAFSANGTDRYPPFSLADDDYPARLTVDYPEHLSRGLVLVKWWLLAIPQYLVVAIIAGGGLLFGVHFGLVGLLVLFAAVALLFTGTYPRSIFDLAVGLNRWAIRVAAYAGLMTDAYPPFRLDMGEAEPGTLALPAPPARAARPHARGWTGGRITSVVIGSVLALLALGGLAAGVTGVVLDRTQRDEAGYLATGTRTLSTGTYALVSGRFAGGTAADWLVPGDALGTVRVRVAGDGRTFVGIARDGDVAAYLGGVRRAEVRDVLDPHAVSVGPEGGTPSTRPGAQPIWAARAVGSGRLTLFWHPRHGDWRLVVMNADASRGVRADVSLGATFPDLGDVSLGLIGAGAALLAGGALMIGLAVQRAGRAG